MEILCKGIFVERFESKNPVSENNAKSAENDQNQVTPQNAIDCLPSYTIRLKDPYLHSCCAFCYRTYSVGDRVTCLPCQHHFHSHCIENWLKWVKPTCPEDKKSVIREQQHEEGGLGSQNGILDEETAAGAQCSSKRGKQIFRNGEELEIIYAENPSLKVPVVRTFETPPRAVPDLSAIVSVVGYGRKKHRGSKAKQSRALQESPPKDESSQREENEANEMHNPCTINDKEQDAMFIMSPDKRKRMQESIDAIRRSIKPRVSTAKKRSGGNPEEFQDALKMAVAKLSRTRISSPSKSKDVEENPTSTNEYGHIMGNAGFSYFPENNTGWIYKRATFDIPIVKDCKGC